MKKFETHKKDEDEILFKSIKEMEEFFDEVSNGGWVILIYYDKGKKYGEIISPDISVDIRDKKIRLLAREEEK